MTSPVPDPCVDLTPGTWTGQWGETAVQLTRGARSDAEMLGLARRDVTAYLAGFTNAAATGEEVDRVVDMVAVEHVTLRTPWGVRITREQLLAMLDAVRAGRRLDALVEECRAQPGEATATVIDRALFLNAVSRVRALDSLCATALIAERELVAQIAGLEPRMVVCAPLWLCRLQRARGELREVQAAISRRVDANLRAG